MLRRPLARCSWVGHSDFTFIVSLIILFSFATMLLFSFFLSPTEVPKCHVTKILIEGNSKIGGCGGWLTGIKILQESPKEIDKDTLKQSLIRYVDSTWIIFMSE